MDPIEVTEECHRQRPCSGCFRGVSLEVFAMRVQPIVALNLLWGPIKEDLVQTEYYLN